MVDAETSLMGPDRAETWRAPARPPAPQNVPGPLLHIRLTIKIWAPSTFCGQNGVSGKPVGNMLYLAARTHDRAAVCTRTTHVDALHNKWLPMEIPFLPQNVEPDQTPPSF